MNALEKARQLEKTASERHKARDEKRENKRMELREKYPSIARKVDEFREAFGSQVRVAQLLDHDPSP